MELQEGLTMTDSDDGDPTIGGTPAVADPESGEPTGDDTDSPTVTDDADGDESTDEADGTQTVDDAKTGKRVTDTQAALKTSQAELTQIRQEIAAAKAVQAEIASLRNADLAQRTDTEPQDYLADKTWHERYNERATEDPATAATELLMRERQQFAALLEARDAALTARMQAFVGDVTNPERAELRDTLVKMGAELPWIKELSSAKQIEMAKVYRKAGGNGAATAKPQTLKPSAGSQGGTGRRVVETRNPQADRVKASDQKARAIFGGRMDDDEAQYPMGKPTGKE